MRPPTVYLAGPDVFLANALALGARKKEICRAHGFDALFPLDDQLDPAGLGRPRPASAIVGCQVFLTLCQAKPDGTRPIAITG